MWLLSGAEELLAGKEVCFTVEEMRNAVVEVIAALYGSLKLRDC